MAENEMYLPRPLSLHVKLISLFCMQIHSAHTTRDRLFLCYCSCTGTLNQHLKSFCIREVHTWCSWEIWLSQTCQDYGQIRTWDWPYKRYTSRFILCHITCPMHYPYGEMPCGEVCSESGVGLFVSTEKSKAFSISQ